LNQSKLCHDGKNGKREIDREFQGGIKMEPVVGVEPTTYGLQNQ
jgi:hypothetical protein